MLTVNYTEITPYITNFPDGTRQLWKLPHDTNFFDFNNTTIDWWYENDGELMLLHQLSTLLSRLGCYNLVLRIPFLPYGRQDKNISNNNTFALHSLATILNTLPVNNIITYDVHSFKAKELISRLISIVPNFTDTIYNKYDIIIFPDNGAFDRYQHLFSNKIKIYGEKIREQSTGKITSYKLIQSDSKELNLNLKYKNLLVVDDICDGGATFNLLANELWDYERNLGCLDLHVTHGIFSKGLFDLMQNYTKIYTCDTLFQYRRLFDKKTRIENCSQSVWYKDLYRYTDNGRFILRSVF